MAALFDTCYAATPFAVSDLLSGVLYLLGLGFPAWFWESECVQVLDNGDFTSRMHAPKGRKLR